MTERRWTSQNELRDDSVAKERAGLDEREIELDAREKRLVDHEAAHDDRKRKEQEILAAAERRDEKADVRDADADGRDREADLHSFMHDQAYGSNIQARRYAALDRLASKSDRKWSAEDRSQLTVDDPLERFDERSAE